jgi:hypothetical protein
LEEKLEILSMPELMKEVEAIFGGIGDDEWDDVCAYEYDCFCDCGEKEKGGGSEPLLGFRSDPIKEEGVYSYGNISMLFGETNEFERDEVTMSIDVGVEVRELLSVVVRFEKVLTI